MGEAQRVEYKRGVRCTEGKQSALHGRRPLRLQKEPPEEFTQSNTEFVSLLARVENRKLIQRALGRRV